MGPTSATWRRLSIDSLSRGSFLHADMSVRGTGGGYEVAGKSGGDTWQRMIRAMTCLVGPTSATWRRLSNDSLPRGSFLHADMSVRGTGGGYEMAGQSGGDTWQRMIRGHRAELAD
nr:hypothetical protein [Tanacetum cinerariifolium]